MKHRRNDPVETPIASLIDVVFLLIIFFVVTASVERDIVDESIRLAQAKHIPPTEKTADTRAITINIDAKGNPNIALQPMSPRALQNILTSTRQQAGNSVPVILRSDGDTMYGDVNRVMDTIGRSGLYRVSIAAEAVGH